MSPSLILRPFDLAGWTFSAAVMFRDVRRFIIEDNTADGHNDGTKPMKFAWVAAGQCLAGGMTKQSG